MTRAIAPGATASVVAIEGEMTIWRAGELKRVLLDAFDRPGPIDLDLSRVSEIDTAGVQLLLFARATAEAHGRPLRLAGRSEAVAAVLALLQLRASFDDTSAGEAG